MARGRKFGFSWSAKRAIGVSAMKGRIARATGIPTTRSGQQRKAGRMMGCSTLIAPLVGLTCIALFVACGNPSKPAKLKGDEDSSTISNYAHDTDPYDSGKDKWSKYVARQRLSNPMWEPMKVGSIAEVKGMVLAQFQMHVVQLDGGGGARVKADGNEYWFDGLASGYIDDRVYTFSGVIESGGTKTYQTILGAPRTLHSLNVIADGIPDISHIAKKQRDEIKKQKADEDTKEQAEAEQRARDRKASDAALAKLKYEQSLRTLPATKKEPVMLGSSPLALAEAAKNKALRVQFMQSKDLVELTEETTVSMVKEGKEHCEVKYGEKTYYVATKHLQPAKK